MANMHLLTRLGTAPLSVKYLATPTSRLNWQSVAFGLNKFHSYSKNHDVFHGHGSLLVSRAAKRQITCDNAASIGVVTFPNFGLETSSHPEGIVGEIVKDVESLCHLETTHVTRCRLVISSYLGQQDRRKLTSQDVIQVSSTYKWKHKNLQKGALFDNQGYDILTHFTSCLGSRTQQLVPVRNYVCTPVYPVPDNLEPWCLPIEPLGITFPSYLSEQNVEKIRILAQAEFCLLYGKTVPNILAENQSMRQLPEKFSEDEIFGLPLDLLMKKDNALKRNVPRLNIPSLLGLVAYLLKILNFILFITHVMKDETSESWRLHVSLRKLKEDIEANFYKSPNYEISNEYDAHDVAAALKDFIAELQKPLLTTPVIPFPPDLFVREMEHKDFLKVLNYYFLMMTPEHRDSLQMILVVLHALTQNSAENGLTVQDCAEIFWPVLLSLPPDLSDEDTAAKKKQFFDLTRVFVHYNEFLFTVPANILSQLRRLNRAGLEPDPDLIISTGLVLTSPSFKEGSKQMNIDANTTAEQIVRPMPSLMEKLKGPYLGKNAKTLNFLFENGGNLAHLEETVLDPKTKVFLLWRENSSGAYTIKAWKGHNEDMLVKAVGNMLRTKPVYDDNSKDFIIE